MAHVPGWMRRLQIRVESRLTPAAIRLHRRGLKPAHLSLAQAPLVVLAVALIFPGLLRWAAAALLASLLLDIADGVYARATGTVTVRGHAMDKAMDLFGIGTVLAAVAVVRPAVAVPVALAGLATGVLYVMGWFYDPELITGARAAVLVWLVVPSQTWLFWLPAVAGLAQIPYAVFARRPKDLPGRPPGDPVDGTSEGASGDHP